MQKGALILEGGSYRCLFAAGVLDTLMENDIWFEYVNGVSAGALTAYDYLSRQPGRSKNIYENFCADHRFVGLGNLLRDGNVFDFHFMHTDVCSVFPMNWDTFYSSNQDFEVAATNCRTGRPAYFSKKAMSRREFDLASRASASMPGLSDIVWIDGEPYLDGGCTCPIACRRALELGYDRVVAVLSYPPGYRSDGFSPVAERILKRKYRQYPQFCRSLEVIGRRHDAAYRELEKLAEEGKAFVVAPSGDVQVKRLERDQRKLDLLYEEGRACMGSRLNGLRQYLH